MYMHWNGSSWIFQVAVEVYIIMSRGRVSKVEPFNKGYRPWRDHAYAAVLSFNLYIYRAREVVLFQR